MRFSRVRICYGILFALLVTAVPARADHGADITKQKCAQCHGPRGLSIANGAPYLAGQHANYLAAALRAYAKGAREHARMQDVARTLTEPDIINVAGYYAAQKGVWKGAHSAGAQKTSTPDPQRVTTGAAQSKPCLSCHGADGISTRAGIPSLAGLSEDYLYSATRSYLTETRRDAFMNTFKDAIDEQEARNIAAFFSSLPRKKTPTPSTGNVAAGEQAAATCAGCHGRHGDSALAQFPALSGQNGDYLFKALQAYRDGARAHAPMRAAVAKLPDATLRNLAAYFSSRTPAPPVNAPATNGGFDPATDGARIALGCAGCHGDAANPPQSGMPRLAGLHPDYLMASIETYRSGGRKHDLMKSFVAPLSVADIALVAYYYGAQKPAAAVPGTAQKPAAATACDGCHGTGGNSTTAATPSLAGQDRGYLEAALVAYRDGTRAHEAMAPAASKLTPDEIKQLALWYHTQPAKPAAIRAPESATSIAAKCDRCHGPNGISQEQDKPRIAGQSETYLVQALLDYKTQKRKNSAMHAMSDVLNPIEIRAIAAHYARK